MFYSIYGLCPRRDMDMGGYGFSIKLWPEFKRAVSLRGFFFGDFRWVAFTWLGAW